MIKISDRAILDLIKTNQIKNRKNHTINIQNQKIFCDLVSYTINMKKCENCKGKCNRYFILKNNLEKRGQNKITKKNITVNIPIVIKKKIDDIVQKDSYFWSRSHFFEDAIEQIYPVISQFVNNLNDINEVNESKSLLIARRESIVSINIPIEEVELLDKLKGIDVFLPTRSEIVRLITILYLLNYMKNTKPEQKSESEQNTDKLCKEDKIDDNLILVPSDNGEIKRYRKIYK